MQQLASVTSENYLDVLGEYDGFLLFPQTSPMSFVGCKGCKNIPNIQIKSQQFPQLAEFYFLSWPKVHAKCRIFGGKDNHFISFLQTIRAIFYNTDNLYVKMFILSVICHYFNVTHYYTVN